MEEVLYSEEQGHIGYYYDEKLGHILTCALTDWSLREYKRYLPIWASILDDLRSRGITHVYGLCSTPKAIKWNELWGFENTGGIVYMEDKTDVRTIMKLEL